MKSSALFLAAIMIMSHLAGISAHASSVLESGAASIMQSRIRNEIAQNVPEIHRSAIFPAGPSACKTLLMLPGLYESPTYLKGLIKYFTSHGFNVVALALSGHLRPQDPYMKQVSYKDWRADAREGLRIAKGFGQPVFILGYSTGGTMAADLALRFPSDIAGLFLFAPALDISATVKSMTSAGSVINFQPMDSCNKEKLSPICKTIAKLSAGSVSAARPLLQEGLSWSPFAGLEVYKYINKIYLENKDSAVTADEKNYAMTDGTGPSREEILIRVYSRINLPTFMVLDEADLTVSTPLAETVFQNLPGVKDLILYPKENEISHTNITKYAEDAYKGSPNYYNHFTDELEKRMDRFTHAVLPTCESKPGKL